MYRETMAWRALACADLNGDRWWEVEELVRKLLLSAAVVLVEPGSPLQVTALYGH